MYRLLHHRRYGCVLTAFQQTEEEQFVFNDRTTGIHVVGHVFECIGRWAIQSIYEGWVGLIQVSLSWFTTVLPAALLPNTSDVNRCTTLPCVGTTFCRQTNQYHPMNDRIRRNRQSSLAVG